MLQLGQKYDGTIARVLVEWRSRSLVLERVNKIFGLFGVGDLESANLVLAEKCLMSFQVLQQTV